MKTVYVHIGLHKTGTTTIQDYLIANAELLETHGVFVPFKHRNHSLTFWVNGKQNNQKRQNQWTRLMRKIKRSELNTVVLSSEFFSRDISEIENWHVNFDELVAQGYNIKFILYLRRSDRRFESLFIEAIKGGNGLKDIRDFPYERFIDNWALCQKIVSKFGDDSLIVRKFEEDAKQGLLNSFMQCLGVTNVGIDEAKYQANTKPSLDQLRAIQYAGELYGRLVSKMFNTQRQRRKAIKRWTKSFIASTEHWNDQKSYTLLPFDVANLILADQYESNKKIATTFFGGDMTYLHTEDLAQNKAESLSIDNMKSEHLFEALELFNNVELITESMNIEPSSPAHDLESD
jgi:hypothetical protein